MSDTLAAYIRSYLDDDEVGLWPADLGREQRTNTWSYGLPGGPIDVQAVVAALLDVQEELRQRWRNHEMGGTFYAWYDQQAGQLRCSVTSLPPSQLPFGGKYRATYEAAEVVELAAADPTPGFVPMGDLLGVAQPDPQPTDQIDLGPFPVWVAPIG